jgi:hypothetical protein
MSDDKETFEDVISEARKEASEARAELRDEETRFEFEGEHCARAATRVIGKALSEDDPKILPKAAKWVFNLLSLAVKQGGLDWVIDYKLYGVASCEYWNLLPGVDEKTILRAMRTMRKIRQQYPELMIGSAGQLKHCGVVHGYCSGAEEACGFELSMMVEDLQASKVPERFIPAVAVSGLYLGMLNENSYIFDTVIADQLALKLRKDLKKLCRYLKSSAHLHSYSLNLMYTAIVCLEWQKYKHVDEPLCEHMGDIFAGQLFQMLELTPGSKIAAKYPSKDLAEKMREAPVFDPGKIKSTSSPHHYFGREESVESALYLYGRLLQAAPKELKPAFEYAQHLAIQDIPGEFSFSEREEYHKLRTTFRRPDRDVVFDLESVTRKYKGSLFDVPGTDTLVGAFFYRTGIFVIADVEEDQDAPGKELVVTYLAPQEARKVGQQDKKALERLVIGSALNLIEQYGWSVSELGHFPDGVKARIEEVQSRRGRGGNGESAHWKTQAKKFARSIWLSRWLPYESGKKAA